VIEGNPRRGDGRRRGQPRQEITDWQTLARADRAVTPGAYDIGLRPGTSPAAYARALSGALGFGYPVSINGNDPFFLTLTGLIGTLVLLLAIMAGLGVLNTVVLHTREPAPRPPRSLPAPGTASVSCSPSTRTASPLVIQPPAGTSEPPMTRA
jgi:hypothetical protein